jgi:hypothetical protein
MNEKDISIQDNFLVEEEFTILRDTITNQNFPWYFSPIVTGVDVEATPGYFLHLIYDYTGPQSSYWQSHFQYLMNQLNYTLLCHVRINLNLCRSQRYVHRFHHDLNGQIEYRMCKDFTTSVLHINTNNGYTEFKDGTIVESVANRLVSWPADIEHRVVTQINEQRRLLININYLKRTTHI